jgi:hypothetical protein
VQRRYWHRRISILSLMGGLSLPLGGVFWVAIAPCPVHAYVARTDVILDIQPEESFSAFTSRAETVARAAIQRSFDRDILVSEVRVMIVGQRQGQSSPVLSVQVSRNQWRGRPDTQRWATYLPSAKSLLGFDAKPNSPTRTLPPTATPTVPQSPRTAPGSTPAANSPQNRQLPPPPTVPNLSSPTRTGAPPTTPLPPARTTR